MGDAITSSTSSATASEAELDRQKLADDLDQFMLLLTTQLQNQDPLDPMDSNEFTAQLVQFASVEQQIQQNANLETLIKAQENAQLGSVAGYVGKNVEADSNQVSLVNGEAEFNYVLLDDAVSTRINITDEGGRTIFTTEGEISQGKHGVIWDGSDLNDIQMPDGIYTLTVVAQDADNAPVDVLTTTVGKVTGVSFVEEEPVVIVNNVELPLDRILTLKDDATTVTNRDLEDAFEEADGDSATEDDSDGAS